MWPLRSPLRIQSSRNGVQAASAATPRRAGDDREHPQRLVQDVGAEDGERVAAHVGGRSSRRGATRGSPGWCRSGRARPRPASCPPGSGSRACRCSWRRPGAAAPPRGCRRESPRSCRGSSVPEARRTTQLPSRWRSFFEAEKCSMSLTCRSPTTMSARPARIGATSFGMSAARYWWSASVLTITSAPSFRAASMPGLEGGREALVVGQPDDVVDAAGARATSTVRSLEPSSTTSHSTSSKPVDRRGAARPAPAGSVASSFRHGIWITSFIAGPW